MDELKLSTKSLIVGAVVSLIILLAGPLAYRLDVASLSSSLTGLLVALSGGLLVVVVGIVYLGIALRGGLARNRNVLLLAILMGVMPMLFVVPQILAARSVPAIHDITTNTADPPAFQALREVRMRAPNGLEYGDAFNSPAALAAAQALAYPDLHTINVALPVADAVARAQEILTGMGLEIIDTGISADGLQGRVEATATTLWFGFKDDVIVRIQGVEAGSAIDLRSMSRVGQSDIGANAARIRQFIEAF